MFRKLLPFGLFLVLVLAACGGEASVYGGGHFHIDGDQLVASSGAVVCFAEPIVIKGDTSTVTLAAGQAITATDSLTLTLSTGEAEGPFDWGNCPFPAPASRPPAVVPTATTTPTVAIPTPTILTVYVTDKAKDSQDWRTVEPTINAADTVTVTVATSADVPAWVGARKVWFGRWDRNPSSLLFMGSISFADFQTLGTSDDFVVWSAP